MEYILSKNITSLRGQFGKDYGYAVRRRGNRFFSTRCSNVRVPKNGHLQFIILSAKLSLNGLYISDIRVPGKELLAAGREAGRDIKSIVPTVFYNAQDILNIKKTNRL